MLKEGNSPCYKCSSRTESCHASCEKYLEWSKKHIEENKKRLQFKINNSEIYDIGKQICINNYRKRRHIKGVMINRK